MGNYSYRFTVFTPCYNSETFLHRVYDSLLNQTFTDFEWFVINDASDDNTDLVIRKYISENKIPIQYVNLTQNQMITKSYNMAILRARGEFFLPIGNDDAFQSDALETFDKVWREYKSESLAGVSCLCQDQFGKLVGDKFPQSPMISDYLDICINKKIKGEKWGFIKTDILRKNLFPTDIDVFIEEELLWLSIAEKYKTVYINNPLRVYYMNQPHVSLSNINKGRVIRYSRGQRYFRIIMINDYHGVIKNNFRKFWDYLVYIRMSLHNQLSIYEITEAIRTRTKKFFIVLLLPFVYFWYLKDLFDRRVEKVLPG